MLWMVHKNEIVQKRVDEVKVEEVGQKAYGLCLMPKAWTLPFFVISREFFIDICHAYDEKEVVQKYLGKILFLIEKLQMGNDLIIRSSGEKEGMTERGKYESVTSKPDEIEDSLVFLIKSLKKCDELLDHGIPLVVQVYAGNDISGHLSNERRFAREYRDFVFECKNGRKIDVKTGKVSIRNWRKKYDISFYKSQKLSLSVGLNEALKIVCAFYYYQKQRVHLEFVCKGEFLYLVQCDYEVPNPSAVNPEDYDITMFKGKGFSPQILRKIRDSDKGRYSKIDNVFVYKEVGEPIPPLFLLDDEKNLEELRRGNITNELATDIQFLTNQSLVVRTNIVDTDHLKVQLSKRSNELRGYNEAKEFLIATSQQLQKEGINDYIFIMHNFIPAQIAAFVSVKPMERIVEIQTLWGIPEGLYYNAHDRIIVNTLEIDPNKMNKSKFVVSKYPVYKENFIAPDENGKWVVKKLKPPYDWRCTITDDSILSDIAYRARKIAEYVNEELSIMWFVGIDNTYYNISNMPWYHEKYNRNSYYYTSDSGYRKQYKKKYFYEKEIVIRSENDIEKIKIMDAGEIGIVRIQPEDDELLRSKGFITQIGNICKEKSVNIFLEGSALAHSFYQLISTGATVLSSYEIREYEEKIEYNKLVRDRIPEIIKNNGESVKWASIKGIGLIRELKNKLIEEAYEVIEAVTKNELFEELADLEEVCIALEKNYDLLTKDKWKPEYDSNEMSNKTVFEGAVKEHCKQSSWIRLEDKDVLVTLERKGSNFQVDLLIGEEKKEPDIAIQTVCEERERQYILQNAFMLLSVSDVDECSQNLSNIRNAIRTILAEYECGEKEFVKIRKDKADKKGAFDKAYVLFKTSLADKREENLFNILTEEKPSDIYELPTNARIDVDNVNGERLLLRLTMPVYIRKNEWVIGKKKVNEYFHNDLKIKIIKYFIETKIVFEISVINERYEQLKFNF